MPKVDLVGRKFGKLTVVKFDHKDNSRSNCWECICDCGNTIVARGVFLKNGITTSCGCPPSAAKPIKPEEVKIKVGQKVRFDPFQDITGFSSEMNRGNTVTGTVVYVNVPHKWFSVKYGDPQQRISFKFCEIGNKVYKCR